MPSCPRNQTFQRAATNCSALPGRRRARFGTLKTYVAIFVETCAGYYGAAALYEQLSALSDAELQQRGLSRATLAQDVCQTRKTASR